MKYFLLLSVLLAACSINPKLPAEHDFGTAKVQLNPQNAQPVSVTAPKWLWDKGIRYRFLYKEPTQISTYALDRWVAPPPELFGQFLTDTVKTLNYSLSINLLEFEQQFTSPKQAKVVIRFHVEALSAHKQISKGFYLEQANLSADAAGAVTGFALIARQAADQLGFWLQGQPAE